MRFSANSDEKSYESKQSTDQRFVRYLYDTFDAVMKNIENYGNILKCQHNIVENENIQIKKNNNHRKLNFFK